MLNFVARWFGLSLVANRVMPIMFGQKFLNDPERTDLAAEWRQRMINNHRIGITRAVKGVVDRKGVYDQIDQITSPALIIVGDQDVATVPAKAERMYARIAGSQFVIIPGAGTPHLLKSRMRLTLRWNNLWVKLFKCLERNP